MLTDKDEDGDYVIPRIIYSDAYASEMVAYADLILPDTTYLERHDCISLLDRPISEPDAAGDSIRWPVIEPDRDVRPFQTVLLDLGARLGLAPMVKEDGSAKFKDYADYIVNHIRRPGVGPLIGWRGADGDKEGRGEANPDQLRAISRMAGFIRRIFRQEAAFYKPWNAAYQDWAVKTSFYEAPQPYLFTIWSEPLAPVSDGGRRAGAYRPPEHLRDQLQLTMDPLPVWYEPFGEVAAKDYPVHALTQRPMDMYHSWGSPERLAAPDPRQELPVCADEDLGRPGL